MPHLRSRAGLAGALIVTAALAVACSSSGGNAPDTSGNDNSAAVGQSGGATGSSGEPIKLGLLTPSTGTYATYGELNRNGVQLAVDQANAAGGVDGHQIQVVKADTGGTPAGAVSGAQKLAQQEGAKFIIGTVSTPVTTAVSQKAPSLGFVEVGTTSQGDALTGKQCNANFFRVNANDSMAINTINPWLAKQPEKSGTWDVIAADYEYGHDSTAGFKEAIGKLGGKVNKTLFPPLGTTDFGSYLGQLKGGDGLLIVDSGNDIINLYKQALQFGTLKKYKKVISSAGGLNGATLQGVGEGLAGQIGVTLWSPSIPTQATKDFVAAYTKAYGKAPGQFAANAYTGTKLLFAGIEAAHSSDPAAVAKALNGLEFDSMFGKVTMRAGDHQLLVPTYVSEVTKTSDGLGMKTLMTLPASETTPEANPDCKMAG